VQPNLETLRTTLSINDRDRKSGTGAVDTVGAGNRAKTRPGSCPICKNPTMPEWRPFCSKRCADVDLGRWLNGSYAIAGGNTDADEDGDVPNSALDQTGD